MVGSQADSCDAGKPTRLPQELIDHIIDELAKEHSTLCFLSLANRAFVPRTRIHLFRSILITKSNNEEFLDLLCSPWSQARIAPHVVHLSVDTAAYSWAFAVGLLGRWLTNVQTVSLTQVKAPESRYPDRQLLASSFPLVSRLSLERAPVDDFTQVAFVIAMFPRLRELRLLSLVDKRAFRSAPAVSQPTPEFPPYALRQLASLVVDDTSIPFIMKWARSGGHTTGDFKRVDIRGHGAGRTREFLKFLGDNVHRLTMNLDGGAREISLSFNKALRTLELRYAQQIRVIDFTPNLLDTIDISPLRKIAFRCALLDPWGGLTLGQLDWTGIARILSQPRFASLRFVHVLVPSAHLQHSSELSRAVLAALQATGKEVEVLQMP